MAKNTAIIVGISGVSSSGKTTLARLLRDIFPRTYILHEDDFYKNDSEIPVKDGVADWDCLESIDLPAFERTLKHIQETGLLPSDLQSKEDQNPVGKVDVDMTLVEDLKWQASKWLYADAPPLALVDGFLLYSEGMKSVREHFDVKIFLCTDLEKARARREARSGYVTLEGFWEDPPGYVDKVVWPNYAKEHAFLFQGGDVEGEYNDEALETLGIRAVPKSAQNNMSASLHWAFDVVTEALEQYTKRRPGS